MRPGVGDRRHAYEDLTARARIRDAALWHFAEEGFSRATIRDIAATAGVSPGLVRHHFGSKEGLRDACDEAVSQTLRAVNDEAFAGSQSGDLGAAAISRRALRPYQSYISRALVDGSPSVALLFDELVSMTEQWLIQADNDRPDPPMGDRRTRAALIIAMTLGIPLLHGHISRAAGTDIRDDDGERRVAVALLDLYSHPLVTPDLAATARAAYESPPPTPANANGAAPAAGHRATPSAGEHPDEPDSDTIEGEHR